MRNMYVKVVVGDPPGTMYPADTSDPVLTFISADRYITLDELSTYALAIPPDGEGISYERWLKIFWDNSDTTTISNVKVYFTGDVDPGAHLRIGTSDVYDKPANTKRVYTDEKTYGYIGGLAEISPSDPTTWLQVPVHAVGDTFESDYIVMQLVASGPDITSLDLLTALEIHIVYDEY